METIKTLIVGALVNGWIYGEKFYYFAIGRKEGIRNAPIKS